MNNFKPKKNINEKIVISVRIDINILNEIDDQASKIDVSRNELITQCIKFALENIEMDNNHLEESNFVN